MNQATKHAASSESSDASASANEEFFSPSASSSSGLAGPLSPPLSPIGEAEMVSADQVAAVRKQLEPCSTQADDATIRRFIRATGGNLALSVKRLNTTCAWRAQVQPEQVVCKACVKDPRSHYMHLVGYCSLGRPIIYSCLANPTNKVFEDNKAHMIQTFEWAIKCMPPGVEQWIWVCDFKGFGLADVNPKLAKLFLDISAEHYPECLGMFMIVDAPSLFGLLWKAIQSFVDPKTYKKIRFLPFDAANPAKLSKSALKAEMDLHFDPMTTAWLIREMSENRDKAKVPHKLFNYYSMYEQALGGELCNGHEHKFCHHGHMALSSSQQPQKQQQEAGKDAAAAPSPATVAITAAAGHGGHLAHSHSHVLAEEAGRLPHNFLGTPALLHNFNIQPELLLPQATATA